MKILVVRIGRAGDMVMITPALKALTEKYPAAEITILTSTDGRRVLKDFHPQIKNVWILIRKTFFPFLQRRKIKRAIQQTDFQHIFCFETKPSFTRLFRGSAAQIHILQNIKQSEINFAERCLKMIDPVFNKDLYPVFLPVQNAARKRAQDILQQAGIIENTFLIGIHPSYSGLGKKFGRNKKSLPHRNWPISHWGNLCKLIDNYAKKNGKSIQIIMDLMPEEKELGLKIIEASQHTVKLLTPQPDFERYKATLAGIDLLIVPNTGPMHIAAAVGTNIVSLFSIHNPKDCAPYTSENKLVVLRAEDCQHPELGLAAISAEDVFQASKVFLPH
ncbi:MAG: glycosyltransferase family 9 protein [Gammaproteobacteria bacterium]|nr:glycosyltransferase family 9 protein [Gammaproteobacteria bacterium]